MVKWRYNSRQMAMNQGEIGMNIYQVIGNTKKKFSELEMMDHIRQEGLPVTVLSTLSKEMTLSKDRVCEVLGLSSRTISRRTQLKKEEADKLYRLARLFTLAINVLEKKDHAIKWLNTSKRALGDQIPLTLMDTEIGAREVEKLLNRIEYGVYS